MEVDLIKEENTKGEDIIMAEKKVAKNKIRELGVVEIIIIVEDCLI